MIMIAKVAHAGTTMQDLSKKVKVISMDEYMAKERKRAEELPPKTSP